MDEKKQTSITRVTEPIFFDSDQASDIQTPQQQDPTVIVVSFEPNDPDDPHSWSILTRTRIVGTTMLMCINSTMGSALSTNIMPAVQRQFGVPDGPQTVLPTSLFLVGFVFGPLLFAPLSETYGRRPILRSGFVLFVLATLASALAPSWPALLVFRLLAGTFASPPMSVVGGVIADVFADTKTRGQVLMAWSAVTFIGPLTAPVVTAFSLPYGWRWSFRIATIIGGISAILVFLLPETLATRILHKRARKLAARAGPRDADGRNVRYIVLDDAEEGQSLWVTLRSTLSTPFVLLFGEAVLSLTCAYLAFVYAIFYMMLEIFPYTFENIYGFNNQQTSGAFAVIGLGTCLACLTQLLFDRFLAPALIEKHPTKSAEYIRLPLACVGGPALVLALLWLGWTARAAPSSHPIHWIVPLIAAIPYGFAYQMIFQSMLNYVADAYGSARAASALAACSTTRSLAGALIPLASPSMLRTLGVDWSATVLALVSAGLSVVPFGFIAFAERIHKHSPQDEAEELEEPV